MQARLDAQIQQWIWITICTITIMVAIAALAVGVMHFISSPAAAAVGCGKGGIKTIMQVSHVATDSIGNMETDGSGNPVKTESVVAVCNNGQVFTEHP